MRGCTEVFPHPACFERALILLVRTDTYPEVLWGQSFLAAATQRLVTVDAASIAVGNLGDL